MMANKSLDVFYKQKQVGTLAEMPDKRVAFQYSDSWVKNGFSINPLALPLNHSVFVPQMSKTALFHGLYGIFADSLPDAWGELLLERYLDSVQIDSHSISILERLAYIGTSGMGALEYYPSKNTDYDMAKVGLDYDQIAEECSHIFSSNPSDKLDLIYHLAASSGGTSPKILIRENGKDWMIKFPAQGDPSISGKREYDYSVCAKECGINMTVDGEVALIVVVCIVNPL